MRILGALLVVLGASSAFAKVNAGKTLENTVEKMGTCYGINMFEGNSIDFHADGSATVNTWKIQGYPKMNKDTGAWEYIPAAAAKATYNKDGKVTKSAQTDWAVKGSSVYVGGFSAEFTGPVAVQIGFKSGTCQLIYDDSET